MYDFPFIRSRRRTSNLIIDDSADWVSRSTESGVILADRLNTSTKLVGVGGVSSTNWLLGDATKDHVTLDTSVYPEGSNGSWKFTVLNTDTTASGNVGVYFGNIRTFGPGDTYWASFRKRASPQQAYQPRVQADTSITFAKMAINSWNQSSSMPNETVIVGIYGSNCIAGYHQNGSGGFIGEEITLATPANNNDVESQPLINNGANPLTGVNPDTGAAWSIVEQSRAQHGLLYSARSNPRAENYREGYGDPFGGGIREIPNQWITYTVRVVIGTNWANSRYTLWVAYEGQPYIKIFDSQGITLGNSIAYDTLWLLVYYTNAIAGGRSVSSRTNNISGTTIHVVGNATPIGDGTLEYNASTQRFRWSGSGESFGVTRGFSVANDILTLNVTSSGASNSFLVVEVNPALLPSSGTLTDTITIANGRPEAYAWYADTIISTQPINAPGGYAPVG